MLILARVRPWTCTCARGHDDCAGIPHDWQTVRPPQSYVYVVCRRISNRADWHTWYMVLPTFPNSWQQLMRLPSHACAWAIQTPTVGLEPTTTRLRALRSADWARRAIGCCISYPQWNLLAKPQNANQLALFLVELQSTKSGLQVVAAQSDWPSSMWPYRLVVRTSRCGRDKSRFDSWYGQICWFLLCWDRTP